MTRISPELLRQMRDEDGNPQNHGVDPNPSAADAFLNYPKSDWNGRGWGLFLFVGSDRNIGRFGFVQKFSFLELDPLESADVRGNVDAPNPNFILAYRCVGSPEAQVRGEVGEYACDAAARLLYRKASGSGTTTGWVRDTTYD